MKKILVTLLLSVPAVSLASPYFRFIDPNHPQISAGALFDNHNLKNTQAVTDVAIIMHSQKDGSIIPESWQKFVPPEAWTPLQIGGGGNSGSYMVNAGASYNLAPVVQGWALEGLKRMSGPNALSGLKNALAANPEPATLSIAAGPSWAFQFMQDNVVLPFSQWKGEFKWYAGAAWKF